MSRELNVSSVSQVWPLVSSGQQSDAGDGSTAAALSPVRCRFADNTVDQYLWLIKGSQLDVISITGNNVANQRLLGSLNFGQMFNSNPTISHCLPLMNSLDNTPVNSKYAYTLVVVLKRSDAKCFICLVDVRLSLVIKTIDIPHRITSIDVISSYKPPVSDNWPLTEELLLFNGIVSYGTEGGNVFLIDLMLDVDTPPADALRARKITFIMANCPHTNLSLKRRTAIHYNQILCLPLNLDVNHKNRFVYKTDDGSVLSAFVKTDVYVSALQYIPQTAMLCLGFNFGGFQFYNLKTFKLECSCGLDNDLCPVVKFTFQDPENDPKNHCYIWVVRGQEVVEDTEEMLSLTTNAIMYSIAFETKEWIPDYGFLYSGFQGCTCRFEYVLSPNPHSSDIAQAFSSRLIDCYAIPLGNYASLKTSDEEAGNVDLSLLLIAWEAMYDSSESESSTFFALFDLNQWYFARMPTEFRTIDERSFSPYLGVFSLVDIANNLSPDALLSVRLLKETITKFRSQAFQDDIHYYPSSMSFETMILTDNQICKASFLGLPKRCLSLLPTRGPNILIDPKEYINTCAISGILPIDMMQSTHPTELLREVVLTVALENDFMPFLDQVIKEWSSGELAHIGCDSKFILQWILKRVAAIKNDIDTITEPLFDLSGQSLNNFNLSQLYAYESDLKSLGALLQKLQTSGAPTTAQGMQELIERQETTQMVCQYLRILLWLYHCNLLPEHSENEAFGEREVAYPTSVFKSYYHKRRQELHEIHPSLIGPTDLLLIDGMIDSMNPGLSDLWIKAGGDGLYPPPNLHSLSGVYLLESSSLVQKQALMLYSLLDLADYLGDRQSDVVEKFRHFPPVFGLKPALTKMIQAFWGLDHKLFEFALRFLMDPVVRPLFLGKENEIFVFNDLQQRVVTSFLYQDEVKMALIYSQNCSQFALDSALREKLHLNMLLVNQQISRAFHYQRQCRNDSNATELLFHFFSCCEKMGAIEKIMHLSLDELEEEIFNHYLQTSELPNSKQIRILYLVSRNKIMEANDVLNENREEFASITDKELAEKTEQLVRLVEAYVTSLPHAMTKLRKEIDSIGIEKKIPKSRPKSKPLDTFPFKLQPKPLAAMARNRTLDSHMEDVSGIWPKEKSSFSLVVGPNSPTPSLSKASSSKASSLSTKTSSKKSQKKVVTETPKKVSVDSSKRLVDTPTHTMKLRARTPKPKEK